MLLFLFFLLLQFFGVCKGAGLRVAQNLELFGVFKVLVESNGASRGDSEAEHVHHGVPMPMLKPKHKTNSTIHFGESIP